VIAPEDLRLKLTMHRRADDERLDFFFEPAAWTGGAHEHRARQVRRLTARSRLDALPDNTIPYIREAIRCYREGVGYSEWGW
jgi:hypothetical protein